MRPKFFCFSTVFCLLCLNCISQNKKTNNVLPATALKPYGRYILNSAQKLELVSSGVNFGCSFEGKECRIYASLANPNAHNYLQYELDGIYQKRILISGNSSEPILIKAPISGKHTIWIYKATEAHTGPILVSKISADNISAIKKSAAPLIEFIGNSITCGAASDPSEVPCGQGEYHDQHNAYLAYGPRLARELGINFLLSSVSGIGVYRNWNSDGPTMPQVYENLDFQDKNTTKWNFSTYSPDVVSIALGTNDFSNGDGKKYRMAFDRKLFIKNYVTFIQLVRTKYPKARIALLSSPMQNGISRSILQDCLKTIKEQIDKKYSSKKPVALFFFEPMQARGCSGHPNVEDHLILSKQLIPFFTNLLRTDR